MVEKIHSISSQENNKPAHSSSKERKFVSHQLLFDKENIDQLEEILKGMLATKELSEAEDTLEDCEEQEINLEISPSDQDSFEHE